MPLNTQIIRDGEAVKLRWSGFHVAAMLYAVAFEKDMSGPNEGVDYPTEPQGLSPENIFHVSYPVIGTVVPDGEYVLTKEHHFADIFEAGETLKLHPGDKLIFFRSSH